MNSDFNEAWTFNTEIPIVLVLQICFFAVPMWTDIRKKNAFLYDRLAVLGFCLPT
jgi:hypothetical protein